MLTAFLFINAEIGSETKVLRFVKTIDAVEEVYLVYGVYDIVAKIRTESMDELKGIITSRLIRSDGVNSNLTMIVIPEEQNFITPTEEGPTIIA